MAKPKANKLSVFAEIIFISIPFSKMGILENETEIQKCFKTHIKVKNILKTRVTRGLFNLLFYLVKRMS